MTITVKNFLDRGPGIIRLSRKSQPGAGADPQFAKQKGALKDVVVEWWRGSKNENRRVTCLFIDAIKLCYGPGAAAEVGKRIAVDEGKPLTDLGVKQLRNVAMEYMLDELAPRKGSSGAATGYRLAVGAAQAETGASDEDVKDLFNDAPGSAATHVRLAIRRAITAASANDESVDRDAALVIAQQKISEYLRGSQLVNPVLRQLPSIEGTDALMNVVKGFTVQRVSAHPRSYEQTQEDMSAQVSNLTSEQLLKTYRTIESCDMVELRLRLVKLHDDPTACLLLEDLNGYEACVKDEMKERTGWQPASRTDEDGFHIVDIGPKSGQLAALQQTERRAARRELNLQTPEYLRSENLNRTAPPAATAKLSNTGVTIDQVKQELKEAELTVNVSPFLFASGGPFRDPSGKLKEGPRLKNIYELTQAKGPQYLERRREIEYSLNPETKLADDRSGIDPDNHPISAGVNVGRRVGGAAPGYGEVVLVLKDSVKARCTFTPSDSFNAFEVRVTRDKVASYKAEVAAMLEPGGGLPEQHRQALRNDPDPEGALPTLFRELDAMVDQTFGADRPFLEEFAKGPMKKVGPPSSLTHFLLANLAIKIFADKEHGSAGVTTPDRIQELVSAFRPEVVDAIAAGIQDPHRINLPVHDYLEAQVYGGINLEHDVAEIRFFEKDTSAMTPEEKQGYLDFVDGLEQLPEQFGIRVVRYKPQDAVMTHAA